MKIYRDNKGIFKTLQNPTTYGGLVMDSSTIVSAERVLPDQPAAHQPLRWMKQVAVAEKKTLAYVYFGGVIWWTERKGKPSSGSMEYRNMWPALKNTPPDPLLLEGRVIAGGASGLVDRIFQNKLGWGSGRYKVDDYKADISAINTYLVRADNFFVLKDRAWWCDRFSLRGGKLTDGKNFKGTAAKVSGVPKQQDPGGDYNHINRIFIHDVGVGSPRPYQMLTEERRMKVKGLGANYQNYRCVINEYQSSDLETWSFVQTLYEDSTLTAKDHTKRIVGIPGVPVSYKARVFEHYFVGAGLAPAQTGLSNKIQYVQPPGRLPVKLEGGKYRAYMNYGSTKYTLVSSDGINWQAESTAAIKTKGGVAVNTALLIMPGT